MTNIELKQLAIKCFQHQITTVGYCQELETLTELERNTIDKIFTKIGTRLCKTLDNSQFYFG